MSSSEDECLSYFDGEDYVSIHARPPMPVEVSIPINVCDVDYLCVPYVMIVSRLSDVMIVSRLSYVMIVSRLSYVMIV